MLKYISQDVNYLSFFGSTGVKTMTRKSLIKWGECTKSRSWSYFTQSHGLLHKNLVAAVCFSTGVVLRVALCGQDSHSLGEGGAEQTERRGVGKAGVVLREFCLDTNLTAVKERGNFSGFFNEWSLPPAKTTRSPPLDFLVVVERRDLSAVILLFSGLSYFPSFWHYCL